MKKIEHVAELVNMMNSVIKSGDWIISAPSNPELHLSAAEKKLEEEGWVCKTGQWTQSACS